MAGAVGVLALTSVRQVGAQSARKIESMAPELDRVISTSETIRELATGYGGDIGPAEGPVWWAEGRYLLFNDIHTARRMKYTPGQAATVAMEKTNEASAGPFSNERPIDGSDPGPRRIAATGATVRRSHHPNRRFAAPGWARPDSIQRFGHSRG
jgi:sugar lactone lactonase YvrE